MTAAKIKVTATLVGVFLLIIGVGSLFWQEPSDKEQVPPMQQSGQRAAVGYCAKPGNVLALPGIRWSSKKKARFGYDWSWEQDPAYGLRNVRGLVEVRANGDSRLVRKEGKLPSGDVVGAHFPEDLTVTSIEFRSLEVFAVCMKVVFMRKRG